MIIALPTVTSGEKSFISEHLGRSNFFYIYDTDKKMGEVFINQFKEQQGGVGIKTAELLITKKVDVLITPRIGEKALKALKESNMKFYECTDKIVKDNIESYLNGELKELF